MLGSPSDYTVEAWNSNSHGSATILGRESPQEIELNFCTSIQGMLYERTAVGRKPRHLARQELAALCDEGRTSPDLVFRDPHLLDLLGLNDVYSETNLESTILRDLERFLLELGSDFSSIARRKQTTVDRDDYCLDLLFFHRRLRRLLAVDPKLGHFRAADNRQMELYFRWLE